VEAPRPHDAEPDRPPRVRTRPETPCGPEKGALRPDAGYELWFQDETEPTLLPYLVGCWGPRGEQTLVPTPGKNAKRAVFGALQYGAGRFLGLTCPRKNSGAFCELLLRMAQRARRTGRKILMVADNARFHTTKKATALAEELRSWVRIVWLPKYASNLNEIEPFWKHVKSESFGNRLYRSREEFEGHVEEVVAALNRKSTALDAWRARRRAVA